MARAGTVLALVSAVLFPWPLTVCLALGVSLVEPLVPFVVGLFLDTLYFMPHGRAVPLFSIIGALVTAGAFFVQSRLKTGSIER